MNRAGRKAGGRVRVEVPGERGVARPCHDEALVGCGFLRGKAAGRRRRERDARRRSVEPPRRLRRQDRAGGLSGSDVASAVPFSPGVGRRRTVARGGNRKFPGTVNTVVDALSRSDAPAIGLECLIGFGSFRSVTRFRYDFSTRWPQLDRRPEQKFRGRATIRDIADLAGVSIATVSRVLNDRPDVAPETRETVLQVVREHGLQHESRRARAVERTHRHRSG